MSLRTAGPTIRDVIFVGDTLAVTDELSSVTLWDLAAAPPSERRLPLSPDLGELRIAAGADETLLLWPSRGHAEEVLLFDREGARRGAIPASLPVDEATLTPSGRLAFTPRRGLATLVDREAGRAGAATIRVGAQGHRWLAVAETGDGTSTRLAAVVSDEIGPAIEIEPAIEHERERVVVWEVALAQGERPSPRTPHLIFEVDALHGALADQARTALLLRERRGARLWPLAGDAITDLPDCVPEIHEFAVADDKRSALLVGGERVGSANTLACIVDLDSGAYARLPVRGDPWTWDGGERFGSVYQGVELELLSPAIPDDFDGFQRWLERRGALAGPSLESLAPGARQGSPSP